MSRASRRGKRKITPKHEFYSLEHPNDYETGIEGYEQ